MRLKFFIPLFLFCFHGLVLIQFGAIAQANQTEKNRLFFAFNQPGYAPGDTVFFTGYLLPIESKQIVNIKLFGLTKELILHERIPFHNGVGNSQIIIPQNMEPGNYQVVSYVEGNNSTSGRVFYFGHITVSSSDLLHNNDLKSSNLYEDTINTLIALDHERYERRSKVNVSVNSKDLSTSSMAALSIAVYNERLFKENSKKRLTSMVETVGIRQTQGSTKIQNSVKLSGFAEYFRGRAFISSSGLAVPDSSKITFYLTMNDFPYFTYTQADGNFSFPLFNNFGDEQVFYRITHKGNILKDSKITLYDTPIEPASIHSSRSDTLDAYGVYSKQKQLINGSYHYFVSKERKETALNMEVSDVVTDQDILLEKFEPFPSMAEVFSNVVPAVRYRKIGDHESIRIFLERTAKYGANDPIYIVNGVMTDDTKYVLSLDPTLVHKIGVLRTQETLVRFGDLGLDGMLVIETDISGGEEKNKGSGLSVIGICKALEYRKVIHHQDELNSKVPDLRSCLYWNPSINLSKTNSFDFYTSDDIGYYIIQVAGIIDGQPFLTTKRFFVAADAD